MTPIKEVQTGGGMKRAAAGLSATLTKPRLGPRSLARVLKILELLSKQENGQTLTDICRALDSPRSSILSLLKEMVALGYLTRSGGHYKFGQAAFDLATAIIGHRDADSLIQSVLNSLSEKTGLTIIFSEFLPGEGVMIHRNVVQSTRMIRYVAQIGSRRPLDTTASGRAVLAFSEPGWRKRYLDEKFGSAQKKTAQTARSRFEKLLESVRRSGCASSLGDFTQGVGACAAPILDIQGHAIAAVTISGPETEIRTESATLAALLPKAALQIARILNGRTMPARAITNPR